MHFSDYIALAREAQAQAGDTSRHGTSRPWEHAMLGERFIRAAQAHAKREQDRAAKAREVER